MFDSLSVRLQCSPLSGYLALFTPKFNKWYKAMADLVA